MEREIKVAELFAGVGGFRIGLENASSRYRIVWSNQWEPSTKAQPASEVYVRNFGSTNHSNKNISEVEVSDIPDHDLLVGGFPCQDYSVASTLKTSKGLVGKKGVLWWEIHRILSQKKNRPRYLFLENVDRLLKSPAKQRGRDFAIMLASLSDLGYAVEWRVINAADYGMPQRRRRVFFLGYLRGTKVYKSLEKLKSLDWLINEGIIAKAFEVIPKSVEKVSSFEIDGDLVELSKKFGLSSKVSPFSNSGVMIDRKVHTIETQPNYDGPYLTLGDVALKNGAVPPEFYIDSIDLDKWLYLKGPKKEERVNKLTGHRYNYSEGGMVFPDPMDKPSRTIITGEGGKSPSRFKHVVKASNGTLRRLTPIELERLNMFPDNHTAGATDSQRAFFMGNALVVGIIESIGKELVTRI